MAQARLGALAVEVLGQTSEQTARLGQAAVEVLGQTAFQQAQLGQVAIEALVEIASYEVTSGVTQVVLEILAQDDVPAEVTQVLAEALVSQAVPAEITQVLAEVLVGTASLPPEPEPEVPISAAVRRTIRRLRQSPYLGEEGRWTTHWAVQLDLEAGQGLPSGQGSDPQLMLQWSDDGGHTWSDEHWVSAGALGRYGARAIWRRLGRTRGRLYRVVISDPIKVCWTDMWVNP